MKEITYEQYLETFYWQRLRKQMYAEHCYTCDYCDKKNVELHLHHMFKIYNLFAEDKKYLAVLCDECHFKAHSGGNVDNELYEMNKLASYIAGRELYENS